MKPLVCICIPTYNAAKTIQETLESILSQTYSNMIIHISDNASTDDTLKIVGMFDDPRLHIHAHAENVGGEGNFTRCLQMAEGEYTAIYHADDLYVSTIVEKQVDFLEKSKMASGVLTFATQIDSRGHRLKTYLAPKSLDLNVGKAKSYSAVALLKAVLEHDNFLFCPSAMIRTSVCLDKIKVWNGKVFKSSADLDVWLRLAASGGLGLINEPLLLYRISDAQWTSDYRKNRKTKADIFLVLDYWMKDAAIVNKLSQNDKNHYLNLLRNDILGRILNMIRNDNIATARLIMHKDIHSDLAQIRQLKPVKNMKYFVLECLLRLMLMPVLGIVFRGFGLRFLKNVRL